MTPTNKDKPTLEDLLKFKKAERPLPCFWDQFDRELNQKMLKTLVKKQSIWSRAYGSFKHNLAIWAPVTGVALLTLIGTLQRTPSLMTTPLSLASNEVSQEVFDVEFPDAQQFFKEYNIHTQGGATFAQNTMSPVSSVSKPAFAMEAFSSKGTDKVRYAVSGIANTASQGGVRGAGHLF